MSANAIMPVKAKLLRVQPGVGFAWRPEGRILAMRGQYRGCSRFGLVHDFALAHEILIEYPDGSTKWHMGPAHPDAQYHKDEVAVLRETS